MIINFANVIDFISIFFYIFYYRYSWLIENHNGGFYLKCNKCGSENKADVMFCNKCGANLENNNILCRINSHINILAILIGLFIAVIILIVGAFLFSGIAKNG